MATNKLKTPFFLDRKNEPRELFSLTDVKVATPVTINYVEYPAGTSLETLLQDTVEDVKPYKSYVALLTQTGTSTPTAVVLENTLGGTPTLGYTSAGLYTVTLTGAFTANKTVTLTNINSTNVLYSMQAERTSANVVSVTTKSTVTATNALMTNSILEIRVYN